MRSPCFSAVSFTLLSNCKPPHPVLSAQDMTWAGKTASFNIIAAAQRVYDPEKMEVYSYSTLNHYKF